MTLKLGIKGRVPSRKVVEGVEGEEGGILDTELLGRT